MNKYLVRNILIFHKEIKIIKCGFSHLTYKTIFILTSNQRYAKQMKTRNNAISSTSTCYQKKSKINFKRKFVFTGSVICATKAIIASFFTNSTETKCQNATFGKNFTNVQISIAFTDTIQLSGTIKNASFTFAVFANTETNVAGGTF